MPTEKKRLLGYRGLNKDEPMPDRGIPPMPPYLEGRGVEIWDGVTDELYALGVLTNVDGKSLGRYCQMLDHWITANDFVKENGIAYQSNTQGGGKIWKEYPQFKAVKNLNAELLRLETHFGLTPSSRSRLTVHQVMPRGGDPDRTEPFNLDDYKIA